jgi:hypothetical protein
MREMDPEMGGVAIRGSSTDKAKEAVVKAKHAMDVLALRERPKGRGAMAQAWDADKDMLDKVRLMDADFNVSDLRFLQDVRV